MARHNHITRDIKPYGQCPGCDEHKVLSAVERVACPTCVAEGKPSSLLDHPRCLIGDRWDIHPARLAAAKALLDASAATTQTAQPPQETTR